MRISVTLEQVFIMASQAIYEKAVRHNLPSAFVTSLERVDQFVIGAVLVRHNKPRWYYDNSLDFTSAPLQSLLSKSEQQELVLQTETHTLFTVESESKEKTFDINLSLDGDVSNDLYWISYNSFTIGKSCNCECWW